MTTTDTGRPLFLYRWLRHDVFMAVLVGAFVALMVMPLQQGLSAQDIVLAGANFVRTALMAFCAMGAYQLGHIAVTDRPYRYDHDRRLMVLDHLTVGVIGACALGAFLLAIVAAGLFWWMNVWH